MKRIATLLTFLGFLLVFVPSAQAHTELLVTSPASDSVIDLPAPIELTFNEAPLLAGSAIVVRDGDGVALKTDELTLDGSKLSIAWPEQAQPGDLFVTWRAVADDGHVITGEFKFQYSGAALSQVQAPPLEATPYVEQPRGQTPVGQPDESSPKLNVVWLLLGLVLLLGALTIAAISNRRS